MNQAGISIRQSQAESPQRAEPSSALKWRSAAVKQWLLIYPASGDPEGKWGWVMTLVIAIFIGVLTWLRH